MKYRIVPFENMLTVEQLEQSVHQELQRINQLIRELNQELEQNFAELDQLIQNFDDLTEHNVDQDIGKDCKQDLSLLEIRVYYTRVTTTIRVFGLNSSKFWILKVKMC